MLSILGWSVDLRSMFFSNCVLIDASFSERTCSAISVIVSELREPWYGWYCS